MCWSLWFFLPLLELSIIISFRKNDIFYYRNSGHKLLQAKASSLCFGQKKQKKVSFDLQTFVLILFGLWFLLQRMSSTEKQICDTLLDRVSQNLWLIASIAVLCIFLVSIFRIRSPRRVERIPKNQHLLFSVYNSNPTERLDSEEIPNWIPATQKTSDCKARHL